MKLSRKTMTIASRPPSPSASNYHHWYAFGSFCGCQTSALTLEENAKSPVNADVGTTSILFRKRGLLFRDTTAQESQKCKL